MKSICFAVDIVHGVLYPQTDDARVSSCLYTEMVKALTKFSMCIIMKDKGCMPSTIGYYIVLAGALNWGLVGLGGFFGGDWNVVHMIFGSMMWVESAFYVLVGAAAVMTLVGCKCALCAKCRAEGEASLPKTGGEAPK